MIRHPVTGEPYETAGEINARWPNVSRAMLDYWAASEPRVRKARLVDDAGRPQVVFHLGDAAAREAKPTRRGRPRRVDKIRRVAEPIS